MHQHTVKGTAGLVAGVVALCLLSLPASGSGAIVRPTGGIFALLDELEETLGTVPIGGTATNPCVSGSGGITLTGTTTGDVAIEDAQDGRAVINGVAFRVAMTVNLAGTYASGGDVVVEGSLEMELQRTTGTGSCTANTSFDPCLVSVAGLALEGEITAQGTLPTLTVGDTVLLNSASDAETVSVSGDAGDCAGLEAADGGSVVVSDLAFEVM